MVVVEKNNGNVVVVEENYGNVVVVEGKQWKCDGEWRKTIEM